MRTTSRRHIQVHVLTACCLLIVVVLAMVATSTVHAQQSCPYDTTEARSDTLEALQYYPLAIGNEWHYSIESGGLMEGLFSETVVADTVISSRLFFQVQHVGYNLFIHPVRPDTITFYRHVTDSIQLSVWEESESSESIRLDADFQTCYVADSEPVYVTGDYSQPLTLEADGRDTTYTAAAIKQLLSAWETRTYAHGIGLVQKVGDPFVVTELVFAKIGDTVLGTPLEELYAHLVSTEKAVAAASRGLALYPQPSSNNVTVELWSDLPSRVSITLTDLLGRNVGEVPSTSQPSGNTRYTIRVADVPNGLYLLRALFADGTHAASPLIVYR